MKFTTTIYGKSNKMYESIRLMAVLTILMNFGCATYSETQPKQKSNLTVGTVKSQIVKGETSQAQILQLFGAPNLVTLNKNENEVWNYNKMSFDSKGADASMFLGFGSKAISTSTTSSFDLILIFDEKDIVINYSIISASY